MPPLGGVGAFDMIDIGKIYVQHVLILHNMMIFIFQYFFRNGSGKSSLLMAIHYVLQPKTRKQIRDLKLFHEVTLDNTSSGFPSAEVELVFNNEGIRWFFSFLFNRAVGRSENPGVPILYGGHNLPPIVEIGLTDLPKFGGTMASPAPPGTTGLYLFTMAIPVVEFSRKWYKIRTDFG